MFLPVDIRPVSEVLLVTIVTAAMVLAGSLAFLSIKYAKIRVLALAIVSPFLNGIFWTLMAVLFGGAFRSFDDFVILQFVFVAFWLGFLCFFPSVFVVALVQIFFGRKRAQRACTGLCSSNLPPRQQVTYDSHTQ